MIGHFPVEVSNIGQDMYDIEGGPSKDEPLSNLRQVRAHSLARNVAVTALLLDPHVSTRNFAQGGSPFPVRKIE